MSPEGEGPAGDRTGSDHPGVGGADSDAEGEVVLRLPRDLRSELKDPMGPVYPDAAELIAAAGDPIIAVGDVVTHHLRSAGRPPDVALVDGLTEREAIDDEVRETLGDLEPDVPNPAGTLTVELLSATAAAVADDGPTTIVVDGEEDLATIPAIVAAPNGASVVYGQPGEGMVDVQVDDGTRAVCRALLEDMYGDHERALAALGIDG